ncbi:MAG: hypothetical protein KIS79_03230 [Burkholderiales bacterium]|nr:hypothetical protein [Burkholderiales bacterium]
MKAYAAWVMLCVATPLHATDWELGRLFHTPAQRAALDEARRNGTLGDDQASTRGPEPAAVSPIMVNGFVARSDGVETIWLNGTRLQADRGSVAGIALGDRIGSVALTSPSGSTLHAKVGQIVEPESGRIVERYDVSPESLQNRTSPPGRGVAIDSDAGTEQPLP